MPFAGILEILEPFLRGAGEHPKEALFQIGPRIFNMVTSYDSISLDHLADHLIYLSSSSSFRFSTNSSYEHDFHLLLELTSSEPLTLVEVVRMQEEWHRGERKCTFVILVRNLPLLDLDIGNDDWPSVAVVSSLHIPFSLHCCWLPSPSCCPPLSLPSHFCRAFHHRCHCSAHRRHHHCAVHCCHCCRIAVAPCITVAVSPSIAIALPLRCRCTFHCRPHHRVAAALSISVHHRSRCIAVRPSRCHCHLCRCCCCPRHHHHPLLLIPLLVGCCVIVCHPISSLHSVMQSVDTLVGGRFCRQLSSATTTATTAATAAAAGPPPSPLPTPWSNSLSYIDEERGSSSTTTSIPTAAPSWKCLKVQTTWPYLTYLQYLKYAMLVKWI